MKQCLQSWKGRKIFNCIVYYAKDTFNHVITQVITHLPYVERLFKRINQKNKTRNLGKGIYRIQAMKYDRRKEGSQEVNEREFVRYWCLEGSPSKMKN